MPATERFVSKIAHIPAENLASARKVPVIEHLNPCPAEQLYRGNVVADIVGQAVETVAPANAKPVSLKIGTRE